MIDLRCSRCSKLLARIETKVTIEIKCTRCNRTNLWSASSASHEHQPSAKLENLRERFINQTNL